MRRRLTKEAVLNDLITVAITIVLTLGMLVFLLNFLAVDTIPGDLLYNVKRSSEILRLSFTFAEDRKLTLQESFNQRRLREVEQLIEQNRAAVVEFQGILDSKGEDLWVIEGYTIVINDDLSLT